MIWFMIVWSSMLLVVFIFDFRRMKKFMNTKSEIKKESEELMDLFYKSEKDKELNRSS